MIERPGGGQHGVSQRFGGESHQLLTRHRFVAGSLPPSTRQEDVAMQLFEAPARALQLIGEEVEYQAVFDGCPQLAKIAWGCDEAFAEVMHPDAIDQNACQQRMIFGSQPPRQRQSSAAGGQ
jgi:hypothetical protein